MAFCGSDYRRVALMKKRDDDDVSMERLMRSDVEMDEVNEFRTLRFNDQKGSDMQMVFGYKKGHPFAVLFCQLSPSEVIEHHGDAMMVIPREVLQVALEQGWLKPPEGTAVH